MFLVVDNRNQRSNYFCLFLFLVRFGSWLGTGPIFIQRIHLTLWIIFISLVDLLALVNHDALYFI